ncbi:hypothetical protein DTO012A8_8134 [Penicillium roqueforti]|nr:hypothetical protein DTO012A8_8134 [Penicillium roqueforti]
MDKPTPTRSKCSLPREKVFSIQIGSETFRLSGASIASDAPSYFSRFFELQLLQNPDVANTRTLYIDRDPTTFHEIARHLQGYHVRPQDGAQFVKLFADAQFYTFPLKVRVDSETDLTVDGEQDPHHLMISRAKAEAGAGADSVPPAKRPRVDNTDDKPWVVRTGQWRLQVQTGPTGIYEVVLVAVKLDIYTSSQVRNRSRKFL